MISPDKADIIEVTSQYYGTVFTSPDGKGKSESHSKTLSEKVIKAGKRALPVGDEIPDLTEEDICDILESRGQRRYKQNPTTGLMEGSYPAYGVKMSKKEIWAVSSGLKTDHPNLKSGEFFPYEYGNHFYLVDPLDSGGYRFMKKISLTPRNQARINRIRKEYGHNE